MRACALVALALLLDAAPARAQSLESMVMPGKVIEGHAKIEAECAKCHVRFDKAAQTGQCRACHKDIAADTRERRGYHGRAREVAGKECRACHTEHKGREARIVVFEPEKFDHATTGFALQEGHARPSIECRSCHSPGRKYRAASPECNACHAKDDKHEGALGSRCQDCHTERIWKEARFDHARTGYALEGRHIPVKCAACHKRADYKQAPRECLGCHQKDDTHKGRYGAKCDTCHDVQGWKSRFRHEAQTKFALNGKHASLKCDSCHKGHLYRDKLETTCVSCHRAEDVHRGAQGEKCAQCHNERTWKTARFDHDATRFPLRERHRTAKCEACHRPGASLRIGTQCVACHRKDDAHQGQEGESCERCHGEASWRVARYDHSKSRFPLSGGHFRLACKGCHASLRFRDAERTCIACHAKEDAHARSLGTQCEDCHNARAWKSWDFDHDRRTAFRLEGRHRLAACKACHAKPMGRTVTAPTTCVACHATEDVHAGAFSPLCERCHTADSWKAIRPEMGRLPGR